MNQEPTTTTATKPGEQLLVPAINFKCTPANPTWKPTSDQEVHPLTKYDPDRVIRLSAYFMYLGQSFLASHLIIEPPSSPNKEEGRKQAEEDEDSNNDDNKREDNNSVEVVMKLTREQQTDFTTKDVAELATIIFGTPRYSNDLRNAYLRHQPLREVLEKCAPHIRDKVVANEVLTYGDMFNYMDKTVCFFVTQPSNDMTWVEVFYSDRFLTAVPKRNQPPCLLK